MKRKSQIIAVTCSVVIVIALVAIFLSYAPSRPRYSHQIEIDITPSMTGKSFEIQIPAPLAQDGFVSAFSRNLAFKEGAGKVNIVSTNRGQAISVSGAAVIKLRGSQTSDDWMFVNLSMQKELRPMKAENFANSMGDSTAFPLKVRILVSGVLSGPNVHGTRMFLFDVSLASSGWTLIAGEYQNSVT